MSRNFFLYSKPTGDKANRAFQSENFSQAPQKRDVLRGETRLTANRAYFLGYLRETGSSYDKNLFLIEFGKEHDLKVTKIVNVMLNRRMTATPQ